MICTRPYKPALLAFALVTAAGAAAAADETSEGQRLDGDISAAKVKLAERLRTANWYIQTEPSAGDGEDVSLSTQAEEPVQLRFKGIYPALEVRCLENETALILHFDGAVMSDSDGYGDVTFRTDNNEPFTRSFSESNDRQALGLSGRESIPLVQKLFGANTLLVRASPYGQSAISFELDISDLEEASKPLRAACNW
jgi:type VI secretion system protein VasI